MAYSSILGADKAPTQASGRDSDALGPSDNSDSGSDAIGTHELHADSDASGTGERGAVFGAEAEIGGDIMPDRIVNTGGGFPEADPDGQEFTDLDADSDADELDDEADR